MCVPQVDWFSLPFAPITQAEPGANSGVGTKQTPESEAVEHKQAVSPSSRLGNLRLDVWGPKPNCIYRHPRVVHCRGMRVAGILPPDAPDPRAGWAERLKLMPIQVMGLAPQPSLEDTDSVGVTYGQDDRGYNEMTASITYTLWQTPDDGSAPVILADLDEKTRR